MIDHLSPYLFILCNEGFTALLRKYESMKRLHGVKVARGAPCISHMLFVDDSYVFCKASTSEANSLNEILNKFELPSCHKVKVIKSSIFFSKIPATIVKKVSVRCWECK